MKFFMVYAQDGGNPTKRYEGIELATAEATRLAHKNGKEAFVLQAVHKVVPKYAGEVVEL